MAAPTLGFSSLCCCSSSRNASLSLPSRPSLSLSQRPFPFPLSTSRRPNNFALSTVPKFTESEAPVLEADPLVSSETLQVEPTLPAPKREEIFAVVMVGSRQYIVFPGRWIHTQRLKDASVNDKASRKIILSKVLLVGTKTSTYIGKPVVTNAAVHAVVEEQLLDDKVIVFKYKKKKNYRRNIGHRQPITRIRITGITGYEDYPAS
ncbi:hypothetical protein V2J09_024372 [Rumex salicifolius]